MENLFYPPLYTKERFTTARSGFRYSVGPTIAVLSTLILHAEDNALLNLRSIGPSTMSSDRFDTENSYLKGVKIDSEAHLLMHTSSQVYRVDPKLLTQTLNDRGLKM